MATIAEQLTSLANTKTAIKDAIVAKGVAVADTDPFSGYAAKIGQISGGGGAPATKFGVSIDNMLGSVDENGTLTRPEKPFVLDLTGVKSIGPNAFVFAFYGRTCTGVVAKDVVNIGTRGFQNAFNTGGLASTVDTFVANFDGIEEITNEGVFSNMFASQRKVSASFKKLKKVNAANVFDSTFSGARICPDETFPVLEEVGGKTCFSSFMVVQKSNEVVFSKAKRIVGSASAYDATFRVYSGAIWKFPSATELSGYVFYSSGADEIHFATANQAAIEACDGYDNKFGATNATIYFDLMLNITVNGVVYDREHTIGGYTSWKDTNENLVYTDATAEPAVGTVVYSDQGVTELGTVSEVA